ncbi:MAG: hypothetical protein ILP13_07610, partial [Lachnospiraceae bacterium]|nr:hypothetical protein [Lachnospiraceae bacterium]
MKLFRSYVKSIRGGILFFLGLFALLIVSFALYGLPMKAVLYPILLCLVLGILYFTGRFLLVLSRYKEINELKNTAAELIDSVPDSHTLFSEDYG